MILLNVTLLLILNKQNNSHSELTCYCRHIYRLKQQHEPAFLPWQIALGAVYLLFQWCFWQRSSVSCERHWIWDTKGWTRFTSQGEEKVCFIWFWCHELWCSSRWSNWWHSGSFLFLSLFQTNNYTILAC